LCYHVYGEIKIYTYNVVRSCCEEHRAATKLNTLSDALNDSVASGVGEWSAALLWSRTPRRFVSEVNRRPAGTGVVHSLRDKSRLLAEREIVCRHPAAARADPPVARRPLAYTPVSTALVGRKLSDLFAPRPQVRNLYDTAGRRRCCRCQSWWKVVRWAARFKPTWLEVANDRNPRPENVRYCVTRWGEHSTQTPSLELCSSSTFYKIRDILTMNMK